MYLKLVHTTAIFKYQKFLIVYYNLAYIHYNLVGAILIVYAGTGSQKLVYVHCMAHTIVL